MSSIHVPTSITPQNPGEASTPSLAIAQSIKPHPSFVDRCIGQPNSSKLSPTKSRQPRTGRGSSIVYNASFLFVLVGSRGNVPAVISNWQLLAQFRRNDGLTHSDFIWIYIGRPFPLSPSLFFCLTLLFFLLSCHRVSWSRPLLTSKLRVIA